MQSKRNALFVLLTDGVGGAERVTINLANHLSKMDGWHVEIFILWRAGANSFTRDNLGGGIEVTYGGYNSPLLGVLSLLRIVLRKSFDLTFSTHTYTNALLSVFRRLNLLQTKRLVSRESSVPLDQFNGLKKFLYRSFYRCYGAQDGIIAQTSYMAERALTYMPHSLHQKIKVVPNPIDRNTIEAAQLATLDEHTARLLRGKRNILLCGRLIEVKNPILTLEAFARIENDLPPDVQLVFMGAGPLQDVLTERAASLDIAGRIVFLGQQANPYNIMAACRYGVISSRTEGFPNVLLEMMACGVRSITTTPCTGDLDALSGLHVTATHEVADVAQALSDMIITDADFRAVYAAEVERRSPEKALAAMLGAPDAF